MVLDIDPLAVLSGDTEQAIHQHALKAHALGLDLKHPGLMLEDVPRDNGDLWLTRVGHARMAEDHSSGCCSSMATMSAVMCDAYPPETKRFVGE
jgi:hypothetical protein